MRNKGAHWEQVALEFLCQQGLQVLTQNYQCRFGEIDLIMRDDDAVSFVEVRYRRSDGFGTGADSVDWHKQRRISAAASHFLQRYPAWSKHPCRFDVISISGTGHPDMTGSRMPLNAHFECHEQPVTRILMLTRLALTVCGQ